MTVLHYRLRKAYVHFPEIFSQQQDSLALASSYFFPGLDRLQQRRPSLLCSSTYCTSPTSTTSEMRTVVRGAVSPRVDDATVSAPDQRSRVSLTAFLRDIIFSQHDFRSAITRPASTPIAPQGSNLALFRTASAAVTTAFSMLTPVSEKEFLCVNRG